MEQWLKTFIKHKKRPLQNEESEDGDSDKENISAVANPPITKHRSRPETKRYKAAMEKVTENVPKKAPEKVTEKARHQPYTCRSCGKTRHNSVKCLKKGS
ncbi:hypothetical protein F8M41_018663 [Gigaspora margarita]|uniref:CCHC-type domain-containing protein n=1 Tax=Gigaspora margarita TaxID=4874 RepID=A0A8H4EU44_GIGMA|nr:hypothetical protein F8M41_018663 [Gigaspora margarita]